MRKIIMLCFLAVCLACGYTRAEMTLDRYSWATYNEHKFEVSGQGIATIDGKKVGEVPAGKTGIFSITNGKMRFEGYK
jgi:hypothetical protein